MQIKSLDHYHSDYAQSIENPSAFWGGVAENFTWQRKWDAVTSGTFIEGNVKWFEGAQLNITENCLDRHLEKDGDKTAILWEANDPEEESRLITYRELHAKVEKMAQVLRHHGLAKGDRVIIYMGMVPELTVAVLACARVGAIHSVVFAGFSAQAIADRLQDAQAKMIITADGSFRGAKSISLKMVVDEALQQYEEIEKVIVFRRTGEAIYMEEGRDLWWHEEVEKSFPTSGAAEVMNAEDPLFILYTSGSTGKPKGVVHSCAGYMVYTTYSFINVFQYQPSDIFFCTADVGWITGHSYIVYAPLCTGATTLMFEGVPTYPDAGRFWAIVDKHQATILYTAPTAIRSLMTAGLAPFEGKDLSSLRVLGSVGEPINEEAWHWFHNQVGKGKCPIVDTWWQTETAGIMISNLAGITPAKPTFATLPLPGVVPVILDEKGEILAGKSVSGSLCIAGPWPSVLRTIWNGHDRYRNTYFALHPGHYTTGDGCLRDEDGQYRITGREDDVLNVSGHRIGTAELENAINMHPSVVESAVVGYSHDIKGQGIHAYIICTDTLDDKLSEEALKKEIIALVNKQIGAIAKPDKIQLADGLPKTRSGKIMRRILRKIADGEAENIGDTSTLLDPQVIVALVANRVL